MVVTKTPSPASLVFAWLLLVVAITNSHAGQPVLSEEEYSPCITRPIIGFTIFIPRIRCKGIPMADVREVFSRTVPTPDNELEWLQLTPPSSDTIIPADVLSTRRFKSVSIYCPTKDYHLVIDPDAFRSTRNFTTYLSIDSCNLAQLDFSFLTGFDQLADLDIFKSTNLHLSWSNLPPLHSLTLLTIDPTSRLNDWVDFPTLSRGLTKVEIALSEDDGFQDEGVNRFLTWALKSSTETLRTLKIYAPSGSLEQMPRQLSFFTKLDYLDVSNPAGFPYPFWPSDSFLGLKTVPTGSLAFTAPVRFVRVCSGQVSTIEPGAFKGNFSKAVVNLELNNMTRFESSVFQPMLQQMAKIHSAGYIRVTDNPFDCTSDPCHLAWLIRQHRNLLSFIEGAECSNGTAFKNLNPNGFNHCSVVRLSSTTTPVPTTTSHRPTTSTVPSIMSAQQPPSFVCPSSFGIFPNPADPSTYYQCFRATPYKAKCAFDFSYNSATMRPCNGTSVRIPCCVEGF